MHTSTVAGSTVWFALLTGAGRAQPLPSIYMTVIILVTMRFVSPGQ